MQLAIHLSAPPEAQWSVTDRFGSKAEIAKHPRLAPSVRYAGADDLSQSPCDGADRTAFRGTQRIPA